MSWDEGFEMLVSVSLRISSSSVVKCPVHALFMMICFNLCTILLQLIYKNGLSILSIDGVWQSQWPFQRS